MLEHGTHSISQLHSYFEDDYYVYLVLELCHNGELHKFLQRLGRPLTESEGANLFTVNYS